MEGVAVRPNDEIHPVIAMQPMGAGRRLDTCACFGRGAAAVEDIVARVRGRLLSAGPPTREAEVPEIRCRVFFNTRSLEVPTTSLGPVTHPGSCF